MKFQSPFPKRSSPIELHNNSLERAPPRPEFMIQVTESGAAQLAAVSRRRHVV